MSGGKLLERRLEGRLSLSLSLKGKREREQLPPRPDVSFHVSRRPQGLVRSR